LKRIGVTHDGPPRIKSIHSDPTRADLHGIEGNALLFSSAAWAIDPLVGAIAVVNKLTNRGQRRDNIPIRRRHLSTVIAGERFDGGTEGSDVGTTQFIAAVQLGPPPESQQDRRGKQQTCGHTKQIGQPEIEPAPRTEAGRG
jgi:hypothetical protein